MWDFLWTTFQGRGPLLKINIDGVYRYKKKILKFQINWISATKVHSEIVLIFPRNRSILYFNFDIFDTLRVKIINLPPLCFLSTLLEWLIIKYIIDLVTFIVYIRLLGDFYSINVAF